MAQVRTRRACRGGFAMVAFGPLRTFVAWSALTVARVAAGAARRGLILERSGAERADYPVVLPHGSGRRTHYAPCGRFVRTTAAKMMTKCAARTDPCGPLLGAPEIAPAGLRLPRRWASGVRAVGARVPPQRAPTRSAGVTGGCTGQLEAVAHAAESRAPATGVAPAPWCAATASARGCKRHGADARRAGPGSGTAPAETRRGCTAPAEFRTTAKRRKRTFKQPVPFAPPSPSATNGNH